MTQRLVRTAAALVIGNELLSGKIRDANVVELARALRGLGIRLTRVVMVPDEIETLAAEVRNLSQSHDVVFTSGGVGPTHDDVTVEAVARAFGVEVVLDPRLSALLHGVYAERLTDAHLLMARVPEGAELFSSPDVEWPTPVMRNVWILPGIPDLFRLKLLAVRQSLRGPTPIVGRALFVKLEEPRLVPSLDAVVARHPNVEIGSYPKWFDPTHRTQITFDGESLEAVSAALEDLRSLLDPSDVVRAE
jgi:molybdenum cofactor synthesis domain-containing protein